MRELGPKIAARERIDGKGAGARGLFAVGAGLRAGYLELALLFIGLPVAVLGAGGVGRAPLAVGAMLTATVVLLSLTPRFRWRDLAPVDFWSEWRLMAMVGGGAFIVAACFTALGHGGARAPAGAPIIHVLLAAPLIELVFRVLFLRRYGDLFGADRMALAACAAATSLASAAIFQSVWAGAFGLCLGAILGLVYQRTGGFLLCCACHALIVAAFWGVGLAPF